MSKLSVSRVEGTGAWMASRELTLEAGDSLVGSSADEASLLAACQRGDDRAFGELVMRHERMVFGLAARLLGDAEEARDLSQDVFLQVFRTLSRFRGQSSLRTWIYRIVVNLCRNRHRFWKRRARNRSCTFEDLTSTEQVRLSEPGVSSPYELAQRAERSRWVQGALLELKFEHRLVLVLREIEGLSCQEIASAAGVAVGTVKSRLARGRDAFRSRLESKQGSSQ